MKRGAPTRPVDLNQPSLWSMTADQLGSPAAYFASPLDVKRALSVAGEFTWHYFHLMQTQPGMLHCFYCRDSQLAHGSSVWPHENWHRAVGQFRRLCFRFIHLSCLRLVSPSRFSCHDGSQERLRSVTYLITSSNPKSSNKEA